MEKIIRQALLYDFYGELLNDHQKAIYEDFVLNNYSLTEIAEDREISRQGVYDMIRRCDKLLDGYENKLHLLEKFQQTRAQVEQIHRFASEIVKSGCTAEEMTECVHHIEELANKILEEM